MKSKILCISIFLFILLATNAHAKVYIDIVSAPRTLPIAVSPLAGPYGEEIAQIIADDLAFSGLFLPIDKKSFTEGPYDPFKVEAWSALGAEAVLKGKVEVADQLEASVVLYDIYDTGKPMMEKKYRASKSLLRPLAHSIANDIFQTITGRLGMFRSRMAYVSQEADGTKLYMSDWDGERRRPLKVTASMVLAPHWSPDGKFMHYSSIVDTQWVVLRLELATMKETVIFAAKGTNLSGSFFPSGNQFALSSSLGGSPDIYTYDFEVDKLVRLTKQRGIEVSPAVSPDGETIVYVSDQGGNPQIYTMDKIGYNTERLTYEGKYNTSPAWSPRGDAIAYSGTTEGKNQIYVMDTKGGGLKRLTEKGNNEEPSFSPDGRYIAFSSDRDGYKAVYIMRADGQEQRRVSPSGVKSYAPRWSPQ